MSWLVFGALLQGCDLGSAMTFCTSFLPAHQAPMSPSTHGQKHVHGVPDTFCTITHTYYQCEPVLAENMSTLFRKK